MSSPPSADEPCTCVPTALGEVATGPSGAVVLAGAADGADPRDLRRRVDEAVARGGSRVVVVAPTPRAGTELTGASVDEAVLAGLLGPVVRRAGVVLGASGGTANLVLYGPLAPGERCGTGCARIVDPRDAVVAATMTGRAVEPEEVAAAVGFLLSEAASYVNGVVLAVDGGLSAGRHA